VKSHVLDSTMLEAFESGVLNPLLNIVKRDRDLILEFRAHYATIYCKGHRMDIRQSGKYYEISADEKFLAEPKKLQSREGAEAFVKNVLPFVKQAIAEHRSARNEIECEQALIHANNADDLNTDYFAIDRQGYLGTDQDRIDVLGIYWPDHTSDKDVDLALIEVKFALSGKIGEVADQVTGYYNTLEKNIDGVAEEAQKLLRQKLRMGLITSASKDALAKLEKLRVSRDPKRVKIVLAMVDYNPRSTQLESELTKLGELQAARRLAHPIEVFHLGFGLWTKNARKVPALSAATA
jgi:hypothetical protein